jgi:uncharacterized protein
MFATRIAAAVLLLSTGCRSTGTDRVDPQRKLSEIEIVDCIVEGAVRQMGTRFVYQEPPRMARVSEFECATLGGTFTAYDPAKPDAVIARWLPFAEKGDVEAQHRLGLLYEGVMGAPPDYAKAAHWYGEAAKAGHRESMYALSVLYEKGLGVEKDLLKAINLYRQASGLENDSLMLSSEAYAQIDQTRRELTEEIATLRTQRDALRQEVAMAKPAAPKRGAPPKPEPAPREAPLVALASDLDRQLGEKQRALDALPSYRLLDRSHAGAAAHLDFPAVPRKQLGAKAVGHYYALVIGNNHYAHMPALKTPHSDAKAIAELLSTQYGFRVQLLLDADEEQIKRSIYSLTQAAHDDDNVLIYFAGHGYMAKVSERSRLRGYWLPTNADEDQDVNWVDNWWITDHLDAAKARRALVIADSCYGGVFSTDLPIGPVAKLPALAEGDLAKKLARRSRFVLASGGAAPVIDAASPTAEHSTFAGALLEVLRSNTGAMSIVELYGRVFDKMYASAGAKLSQEPELRVIRAAGHQGEGDFFFVRDQKL